MPSAPPGVSVPMRPCHTRHRPVTLDGRRRACGFRKAPIPRLLEATLLRSPPRVRSPRPASGARPARPEPSPRASRALAPRFQSPRLALQSPFFRPSPSLCRGVTQRTHRCAAPSYGRPMGSESGQATIEWTGLVLLVAVALGALLTLAPPVDGRRLGGSVAHAITCAARGGCAAAGRAPPAAGRSSPRIALPAPPRAGLVRGGRPRRCGPAATPPRCVVPGRRRSASGCSVWGIALPLRPGASARSHGGGADERDPRHRERVLNPLSFLVGD